MRGRKTWDKELQMKEIWNLSVSTLKKALTCMDEKIVPFLKKVEIAQYCFGKMVPKEGNLNVNQAEPLQISLKVFEEKKEEVIETKGRSTETRLPYVAQAINRFQHS